MRTMRLFVVLCALGAMLAVPSARAAAGQALLPDLRTVVPEHLQLVHEHQREVLRFTNGIANTGAGPLRLRPETDGGTTRAVQELLDANGSVVAEHEASIFEYHPAHHHWHIAEVARFEVRAGAPDGPVVGDASLKVTFCLIDSYRLEANSPTRLRGYWDCETGYQGISSGWVDQYHMALDGQSLDITGAPPGTYFVVSTAAPTGAFLEARTDNNTAWTRFELRRSHTGRPKITVTGHSDCDSPGLCGSHASNR